jgi:hypothetical protein
MKIKEELVDKIVFPGDTIGEETEKNIISDRIRYYFYIYKIGTWIISKK